MSNVSMRRHQWDKDHEKLRALLVEVRHGVNLTQTELANLLGTTQPFISKYERGERTLDFIEVLRICDACGYSVINLVESLNINSSKEGRSL